MDNNIPIDRLEEFEEHLQTLKDEPETPLDAKLFDDVELQLTPSNIPALIPRLLPPLTELLTTSPHDPTPLATLTTKLLAPLPFTTILRLTTEPSLLAALSSPSPPTALLALAILAKAAATPSSAAILSLTPPLVAALLTTWLSHPAVAVAESAHRALAALLATDCATRPPGSLTAHLNGAPLTLHAAPAGQGLLWRRIFTDRDIYRALFALCSPRGPLDERQTSLAQGRLLRLLPHLCALDFACLARSHFADVEAEFGGDAEGEGMGLLWFAAVQMVDRADVLMHITLLDFVAELLTAVSESGEAAVGAAQVAYLKKLVGAMGEGDEAVRGSLEALARNEESSPELVRLLREVGVVGEGDVEA